MSIQLDGRVTYPYERDDEEETAEDGSHEGSSPANSITWDGFWHYSQKQPKGGNDLCRFKYYFVGPVDPNDPSLAPNPAAPEIASEAGASLVGGPRRAIGPSSDQAASGGTTRATAGPNASNSSTVAAAVTTGPQITESEKYNVSATTLATYGPRGEGRLPSGKWKGHFIVKYSKSVEVKVEEIFVLEFGPKPQRRPSTPTPLAGPPSNLSSDNQLATPLTAAESKLPGGGTTAVTGETAVVDPSNSGASSIAVTTGTGMSALAASGVAPTTLAAVSTVPPVAGRAGVPTAPVVTVAQAAATVGVTSVLSVAPAPIAPVVRVSGWGENKYGQFTLTGGHERATGRLDLTRFYYEKPREAGRSSGYRVGGSRSHHRRRRPPLPSSTPSQSHGSSIAERRTKRTRQPNQRLLDDEALASHTSQSESVMSSAGGGGVGSATTKRKASGEGHAITLSSSAEAGGGDGAIAVAGTGSATPRARKPRDREHDLLMERARRSKKKEIEVRKATTLVHNENDFDARERAVLSPSEKAAAECVARVEEQREVLAALEAAETDDPVYEQLHRETIASMKERLTTLEAEATTAAAEVTANAEARGVVVTEESMLADHGGSWGPGGSLGGTGGKRSGGSGRSRRASIERWEEMTMDPETQECYEGGWVRGRRHGKGICVYADRRIYEGDWKAGKEHGWGKIMEEDRRVLYEGELADGKLYGKGRYTDGSGAVYDGEWKDNAMHGRGVYAFVVGGSQGENRIDSGGISDATMIYDGEFRDNARCGRGVQTWPGGSYDGEWLDSARHGRGILRTDDGFVYDGQWVDDLPEGRGMCIHPDGQRYEGVFRGGKKEGRGTLAFANGASYEGRFRDDAIDGQGMLHIPKPVEDHIGGWMIPIQFQSDIERIHVKAGFDKVGQ